MKLRSARCATLLAVTAASMLCASVTNASTVRATFTGVVFGSSDSRNVLGYGGSSLADGARVTLVFEWDTATAAPDIWGGSREPWEADYFTTYGVPTPGVLPPSWVESRVIFDNGVVLDSTGYVGDEYTTDQVKVQDQATSWDSYGVHDIVVDEHPPGAEIEHHAGAVVTDYTRSLTNGLAIDQLVQWVSPVPGSYDVPGMFRALGVFRYRHKNLTVPEDDYAAFGDIAIDSLVVQRVPDFLALLAKVVSVGPGKSLANKVTLAQTYYAVPDVQAACAVVTDFVNEVEAATGKKIQPALAADLIADAGTIMISIGCE